MADYFLHITATGEEYKFKVKPFDWEYPTIRIWHEWRQEVTGTSRPPGPVTPEMLEAQRPPGKDWRAVTHSEISIKWKRPLTAKALYSAKYLTGGGHGRI
jgi:hypothetical protein